MIILRLFVFLVCSGLAVVASPRVALVVEAPDASAAAWQSLLTAELSRIAPEIELVERSELARAWTEREQAALAGIAATPAPLGVDGYLHFRQVASDRWIVTRIDAVTGRDLGSFAAAVSSLEHAPTLASSAARLLAVPSSAERAASVPRLAVVESKDAVGDAALFTLAARLRVALSDEGIHILDRGLTQELAIEQNDAARGLRASASPASLLGLDYYLEISPTIIRLVRVNDGVVLALRSRAVGPELEGDEVNRLQRWALPLLGRPSEPASDYLPQVEVEALEPFFKGIAHHDAGRFAEAVGEFTRAYELNGRFRDAYEWSARSHEALGLTETAAALRRFLATEFLENLAAPTGRIAPVDGIVFLGVGGDAVAAPVRAVLSASIASGLARRPELGLRLSDELTRLRMEFDWAFLGEAPETAPAAPSLFTRHVLGVEARLDADGRLALVFTLRDALGLRAPVSRELVLPAASGPEVQQAIERLLAAWPEGGANAPQSSGDVVTAHRQPINSIAADASELVAAISATGSESIADPSRLRLLLAEPGHPLGIVRRTKSADEPLASFLEHGRRADAIHRLPADSSARRWFELLRALEHIDPVGVGPLLAGERIDARAEIARLATSNSTDGAGLMARYHLLFFAQASMSPEDLAVQVEALRSEAAERPDHIAGCHKAFDAALAGLARLARLASSPTEEDLSELRRFSAPTGLPTMRFDPEGQVVFSHPYAMTRYTFWGLSKEEAAANARALLAVNGRQRGHPPYTPELLAAHPRAPALTQHVVLSLAHSLRPESMPVDMISDWDGRTRLARAGFAYALDQLENAFSVQTDVAALRNTDLLATALLGVLGTPRVIEWLPPGSHAEAHARLLVASVAARVRQEFPRMVNPNTLTIENLSPEVVRASFKDDFRPHGIWVADAVNIRSLLLAREGSFEEPAKASTRRSWWWLAARWETEKAFSAAERAELLARPLNAILRDASPNPDDDELRRLLELGLFLFQGKRHADAERVFAPLAALSVVESDTRLRRTFVANACFRLAQVQHIAGRLPEAIATTRRALTLADGHTLPFHTQRIDYLHLESDLSAQCLRLLAELRHDPARLVLPDRVGFVRVPTPNGDNPLLTVYYRLPPPVADVSADARPPRVLVFCSVFNTDPLELLAEPGPWTRFADAHNLVLVSPRFLVSDRSDRIDHLFNHPRFAAAWSGDALLRAVDALALRTPLDAKRLFFHCRVSGAGFASQFAAWRPDRVAAVSMAHGNWSVANQTVHGHQPLSSLVRIPHWIGANPLDSYDSPNNSPRFLYLQDFAARLRSAGIPVEWAEFPAPTSVPTEAMEDAARVFLARQLSAL